MRAELSVVIPTLDAAAALPRTLGALMEGLEAGLVRELIISDGGSGDATRAMAEEVGAIWTSGAPSRGGQLRRGVDASAGAWVLVLHADTVLPEGWSGVVERQISRGRPGYFLLGFDAEGLAPKVVAGWANLRSRVFGLPYGDQGLLISRAEYNAVGGYVDAPLMEDVAMARALGARLEAMPLRVRTSAARYIQDGWMRRGGRNLLLLMRYLCGADPERLRARY
ncbi:glycosyltransferase [Roseovarius sp. LXJ103]|uniref:glycosyltransferase n=1 Tax=Roseovarius carneus TaxID=2853164 RepID=UPI000D603767|nr:glycosyltransferase [Roseovarius carneus]MBZ8117212.1 glycosyltransferase [Roseovarius carneus]PWE36954.1 glycosyl transferase [Pelagicola sp. LXJ1103]